MQSESWLDGDFEIVEPSASPIMESLRAFGYSTATAIADLLDNAIAAKASRIDIQFNWAGDDSWVSITDNGDGMTQVELKTAMRLGSRSPREKRVKGDLGRFGLGLKTASFSQARTLTVLSRKLRLEPALRRWDLDLVERTNEWRLLNSIPKPLYTELLAMLPDKGTIVAWHSLDRLLDRAHGSTGSGTSEQFLRLVEGVKKHLELVFHRYLTRPKPLSISINGRALVGWDPFIRAKGSTSTGPESIPLAGETITIQPFVLPHKSKLSDADHESAAGIDGWNASQGFYVYREDRLLVGGSWLGIGGVKEEHSKLARIQLDIPSALDHLWQVDVRKASIKAPGAILPDLQRIARATKKKAQEVYRFRGKQIASRVASEYVIGWTATRGRAGAYEYKVNRRHPIVAEALASGLATRSDVERLVRFVEETVPVTQIGIALADSLDSPRNAFDGSSADEITAQIVYLFERMILRGRTKGETLDYLATIEPFVFHPAIIQAFREDQL